jgi:hypothetical protein
VPGVDINDRFVIRGFVTDHPAVARWANGRLQAPAELRRRAERLIASGITFGADGLATIPAALDQGGTSALLTMMRCFDLITTVDVRSAAPRSDLREATVLELA